MVKSGGTSQTFSAREFFDTIFAPHNFENKVSLSDWMLKNDVMGKVCDLCNRACSKWSLLLHQGTLV